MTDNRTTELLPCPFCGGEAELKLYQSGDWQIICYHADGCIMRESDLDDCYWESVQTLARQWNTRADYHGYEQAAIEAWESVKAWNARAELGSDIKPCPWCGRDMDKRSEADKDNAGHTWYRDDSDYIQCLIRSNEFMKKERVTHGTLTAEQVMAIAGKHQPDYCSDTHVCFDWQAIADELNAALGRGECKIIGSSTNNLMYPDYMTKWYELSCGHSVTLKGGEPPRFCQNCGKAVKR